VPWWHWAAPLAAQDYLEFKGKDGPGKGKKIALIAGDDEYRSEEGMPMLAKILSQRLGFDCTVVFPAGPDGVIKPTDHGLLSNAGAVERGQIRANAMVTSFGCDRRLHFPHPKYDDPGK
jgi:acetylornithine deacetylase/succinyl-diaminopimelate desuccinylase-like protein